MTVGIDLVAYTAAVANALAFGQACTPVRHLDAPLTREKVWRVPVAKLRRRALENERRTNWGIGAASRSLSDISGQNGERWGRQQRSNRVS